MAFELMAPLMFASLAALLLLGYPVAFALAANGLIFAFVGFELGLLQPELLQALPQRLFGIMQNQLLLAIPFFTFMGLVLERSGMADDLLDTIGQLFGRLRGGVAYAVIFVGALLAASTGVIAASVIAMGLISLPVMLRYGYSRRLSTGVICASGTLAQIIPPSIVLIVLADVLGVSVGDTYLGAIRPAAVLVALLALYVAIVSWLRPEAVPALPPAARPLLRRRPGLQRAGDGRDDAALRQHQHAGDHPARRGRPQCDDGAGRAAAPRYPRLEAGGAAGDGPRAALQPPGRGGEGGGRGVGAGDRAGGNACCCRGER